MADAKVTITGDSSGAEEALKNVADELGALDDAVEELSDSTEGLSSATDSMVSQLGKVSSAAGSSSKSIGTAGKSFSDLGTVLGAVDPRLGSVVSSLSSASSAAGRLSSSMSPLTIGLGGLGVAVGVAVAAWKKYQESVKRAEEEQEALRVSMRNLAIDTNTLDGALSIVNSALDGLAGKIPQVREELEKFDAQFARADARKAANQAIRDSAAALEEAEKAERAARESTVLYSHTLAAQTGVTARQSEHMQVLAHRWKEAHEAAEAARRAHARAQAAMDGLNRSMEETTEVAPRAAASVRKSARDIADELVRTSIASNDLSKALAKVGDKSIGRELVGILSSVTDETLRALGASGQQIEQIRDLSVEYASGSERIKLEQDKVTASLEAQAEVMRSIVEAQREAERIAMAREALEVELSTAAARERMEQEKWFASISRSYEEQIDYETQLRETALARLQEGAILHSEEREALERHFENIRAEQEAQIERAGELGAAFREAAAGLAQSGVGDLVGGLSESLGEAAASGANFGEAMGQSAKKAVAAIAKQYGALFISTGTGMLYMPGQQAQGAGMIAAGAALMAIGGAVGAAGTKPKGKPKDGGGGAGSANVVVDTYEREGPGARARDVGAAGENADRYGIDRGRAWA